MSAGRTCLSPSNIFSKLFNTTFVKTCWLFLLKSLSRSLRKLKNVDLLHWLKNGSGDGRGGSKDIRSCSGPRSALAGAKLHPPSLRKCKPPKIAIVCTAIVDPACIPQLILPADCWVKHFCFHTLHCQQVTSPTAVCMFVIGVHFFISKYQDTQPIEPNQA